MKVGIIHTAYQQRAGEDEVVRCESEWLNKYGCTTTELLFTNRGSVMENIFNYAFAPFNLISWWKVSAWLSREKPDLVHIHNWHFAASPSVINAVKKKGIPVVLTLHNFRIICPSAVLFHNGKLFLNSMEASFPWQAVLNKVYHDSVIRTFWLALTIWLHSKAGTWKTVDKYIVLTRHAQNIFISAHLGLKEQQLVVKPNCARPVPRSGKRRGSHFLFVGRLSEEKGIEVMIRAFRETCHKLVIIGDGPMRSFVAHTAARVDNIDFRGMQQREDILMELQKCTALVFPSLWFEGFPMVIAEAFSCGTPVIGSRLGATEVIVKDGYDGLHFSPGDVRDLGQKINIWTALPVSTREAFEENARSTFDENYSIDKNMETLTSIYKEVLCR
jgi:glycosyltransferase involved in cell wall biosynthesis